MMLSLDLEFNQQDLILRIMCWIYEVVVNEHYYPHKVTSICLINGLIVFIKLAGNAGFPRMFQIIRVSPTYI